MPGWYYEKEELKNTPSASDSIDYDTELRYRREGARFIIEMGTKIWGKFGYNTVATGVVYFHRFYLFHSFKKFPRYVTACCCLFLAGKVEETPKKCRDIINCARTILSDVQFATFGVDPKEEVMTLERILLQTIKFDLQVEHPYSFLVKYAKCLKGPGYDEAKQHKIVQMAWIFINDSLSTTLSLQWEPEIIATALLYLTCKLSQFEVADWVGRQSKHLRWWDTFFEGLTLDLLEDICHQVLDLYTAQPQTKTPESQPLAAKSPSQLTSSSNGQEKEVSKKVPEVVTPPSVPASYPSYPAPPPLPYPNVTATTAAPPPHIVVPPSGPLPSHLGVATNLPYSPYTAPPPPHFPHAIPPGTYYQSHTPTNPPPHGYQRIPSVQLPRGYQPTPPSHRMFYPPPS